MKKILHPSQRALSTPASAVRKLVPLSDQAKARGIKVLHVNIGQPDLPTPQSILDSIHKFSEKTLEYAPSYGMMETRRAWKKFYEDKGLKFDVNDILITSGGSEGLSFAMYAVADPGDEIIVFEPFYTSYSIVAAMGNIKLVPIRTEGKNGYHLPPKKSLEKAITPKTRAIMICNPNNPTGTLYSDDEVRLIARIAQERNLFIISDETYQEIVFDGKKVLPFASLPNLEDHLIIADSVSKRFNACGARIGVVVTKNKELMQHIVRFAMSRLSVATIDQLAVVPMLLNSKKYIESIRRTYEERRNVVVSALGKIPGISFVPSEGAFYIMPKIPVKDSEDFAKFLLNEFSVDGETVMISPAAGFYKTPSLGKDEIRIAYVLNNEKLKRAMSLLGIALKKYDRRKT